MKLLLIAPLVLFVSCTANYETYVKTQENIALANANAQAEKYKAMASIGASGSDAAKVAAMMSLALGKDEQRQVMVAAPTNWSDTVLKWAGLVIPSVTQGYIANQNTKAIMNQANNAASVAISTNETFSAIAGNIQAPAANVTETYTYADSNNTFADSNNSAQTTTTSTTTSAVTDTYTDSNNSFTDSYNPIADSNNPVDNTNNSVDNTDNADNSVSNATPIVVNAAGNIAQ